jgi:hypothetical protein
MSTVVSVPRYECIAESADEWMSTHALPSALRIDSYTSSSTARTARHSFPQQLPVRLVGFAGCFMLGIWMSDHPCVEEAV